MAKRTKREKFGMCVFFFFFFSFFFFFLLSNQRANSCLTPEHRKIVEQKLSVCVELIAEKGLRRPVPCCVQSKGLCLSPGLGYRVTDTSPSPYLCDQHFSSAEKGMSD